MEINLPKINMPNITVPKFDAEDLNPNLASAFYKRIVEMINEFESSLNSEQEVGVRLVNFGQTVQFHIEDINYYNPSLITFVGRMNDGSKVELIQHINQISFLLMAMPKLNEEEPARRLGFTIDEE
jgi:Family of unknown function (DUF6173)